jgi:hypothetical protein
MDTKHLKATLVDVLKGYAGEAGNGYSYLTHTDDGKLFTVISVAQIDDQHVVDTDLVVRLQNDVIVIERDVNDKILLDALVQAGVPREQIIPAYAGEPVEAMA